ncbi:ABC transporter permease [Catellatospora citrea]|uniref:ABC transporter permease n=1 Tax=Catellatospora citrea TaxID=53366 RepID=A0A8J3KHH7_9ACTN|nr:ABC transporter permease [Catellatospora citrea]RKE12800.1 peptide/nickel transport system permease protein [Catellatospora citrea]GIF95959.1 ABC transporter permease [Catellatospora citrea]
MTAITVPAVLPERREHAATRRRAFRPGVALGLAFLGLLAVAAVTPGLLTSHDPLEISTAGAFVPPGADHLLGTDQSGRDTLARMVYGARSSLLMGLGATAIAVALGSAIGLLAGLANRYVEGAVMRLIDVALSIPDLLLALVVITLLGTGTVNALFAVAFASVPYYARMIRAQTHVVRAATYVEAATALGLRRSAVIRRHVLPNAFKPLVVLATIGVGNAIGAGASLSFLGLGTKPPAPEWGNMLSLGIQYISNDPFMVIVPGLAITLTVLSVTVVGRDLRRRTEGRS